MDWYKRHERWSVPYMDFGNDELRAVRPPMRRSDEPTLAALRRLATAVDALMPDGGAADEVKDIQVSLTYMSKMSKRFPSDSTGDTKIVKVTFSGSRVSAVLDSFMGSERVYKADLSVAIEGLDAGRLDAIKAGPWLLVGTVYERVKLGIKLEDIINKGIVEFAMNGTDASDPIFRGVAYQCNGMMFTLWKELSTWEKM